MPPETVAPSILATERITMLPMSAPAFQIRGRAGAKAHILHVTGAITYSAGSALQEAVKTAAAFRTVIIDLSEVPWVDSMAIGAIVRVYLVCNKAGQILMLVGVNQRIKDVLRLTGLDSLFAIYSTISEAESALS
jgi:anti-sigma B factor antagonist